MQHGPASNCSTVRAARISSLRSARSSPPSPIARSTRSNGAERSGSTSSSAPTSATQDVGEHPDLLIAAAAEAAGMTVLHYDEDYDRVSAITDQPTRWLAPKGSLPLMGVTGAMRPVGTAEPRLETHRVRSVCRPAGKRYRGTVEALKTGCRRGAGDVRSPRAVAGRCARRRPDRSQGRCDRTRDGGSRTVPSRSRPRRCPGDRCRERCARPGQGSARAARGSRTVAVGAHDVELEALLM